MAFETDESGAVSQASLYQPYGASLKDSKKASEKVSTYSFSGKEEDGSGLYYFEARYYDPVTTRFVSPDPLFAVDMEKCIESIIECNLYQYTGNNPVNFVDPTGGFIIAAAPWVGEALVATGTAIVGSIFGVAISEKVQPVIESSTSSEVDTGNFGRIYVTYTKESIVGVYSGRTSAVVDLSKPIEPQALMAVATREQNHHTVGFEPAEIDEYAVGTAVNYDNRYSDVAYYEIRGREQQLIDFNGKSYSDLGASGNSVRGVAKDNPIGPVFHEASSQAFGEIHEYTGD